MTKAKRRLIPVDREQAAKIRCSAKLRGPLVAQAEPVCAIGHRIEQKVTVVIADTAPNDHSGGIDQFDADAAAQMGNYHGPAVHPRHLSPFERCIVMAIDETASLDLPVITIDGPTASGKGTLASALATRLGYQFLDSGSLYRITGLLAVEREGRHRYYRLASAEVAHALEVAEAHAVHGQKLAEIGRAHV